MTTDDNALTKLGVWDRYTIYIAKSFTLIKYMFNSSSIKRYLTCISPAAHCEVIVLLKKMHVVSQNL